MSNTRPHQNDPKHSGNVFIPYILYLAGILGSSVILVAAAISGVKDANQSSDWQKTLFAFIFWMAATIIIATLAALYMQARRTWGSRICLLDIAVAALPSATGAFAAAFMMAFAARHGHPFFW